MAVARWSVRHCVEYVEAHRHMLSDPEIDFPNTEQHSFLTLAMRDPRDAVGAELEDYTERFQIP